MRCLVGAVAATTAAIGVATGVVLACGPFLTDLITINSKGPAYVAPYRRGELGVVKPTFYRRYLVQAYRVFNGRPAVPAGANWRWWEDVSAPPVADPSGAEQWVAQVQRLRGPLSLEQRYDLAASYRRQFPKSEWARRTPYWYR